MADLRFKNFSDEMLLDLNLAAQLNGYRDGKEYLLARAESLIASTRRAYPQAFARADLAHRYVLEALHQGAATVDEVTRRCEQGGFSKKVIWEVLQYFVTRGVVSEATAPWAVGQRRGAPPKIYTLIESAELPEVRRRAGLAPPS